MRPGWIAKEELPALITGARAPVWWAMILLVAIESTVFATLITSLFYLRLMEPVWPPPGVGPPDLLLPLVNTGVLLVSSIAVYWGSSGIRQGNARRLKIGFGVGVALEVVFFGIKVASGGGIGFDWTDHAYGSVFWTINRLHSGHVLAAILMGLVVEVLAFRGYFTRERRLGVDAINIYWQFVAVVWVPVLLVLYLLPHWL